MSEHNILTVSWENYLKDVNTLSNKILLRLKNDKTYSIIAISRGGLIPATIISHKLNIKKVFCLGINSYEDKESTNLNMYQTVPESIFDDEIIVIDDLVDSGQTINFVIKTICQNAIFAAIYNKIYNNDFDCCITVHNINIPCWIKLPYEE
jgi:xanthine phosphoribosyltransferase